MELLTKLFSFVPDELLKNLASDTKVNKYAKKLQGELVFKLLVYCLVTEKENSLRGMQSAFESSVFSVLAGKFTGDRISYSSLSERLSTIKCDYFERIFQSCVSRFKRSLGKDSKNIIRFDSTIVSLSGKLLKTGYHLKGGDADKYRLLKFTIGFTNIPEAVYFYNTQTYNSENVALSTSIITHSSATNKKINIFDRGITSRDNYDRLTESGIDFISRINNDPKQECHKSNALKKSVFTPTLKITSDKWVYLYTMHGKRSKYPVRLLTAVKKDDGQQITFLTNIKNIKASDITEIYKSRWEIEVFFKFIKQHLNFSHLVNRSENGIKTMLFVTMTVAILLQQYKKEKNLKGFKIAKQKFAQDIERAIIFNLVILCDGHPEKTRKMLYPNSS